MEKLIKLQALIQQIETFALTDCKYQSSFTYQDETTLTIETYCTDWTIAIYQMFSKALGITMYLDGNSKITVLE